MRIFCKWVVGWLLVSLLVACVTTQKGGFASSKSTEEAAAVRVNAAKQYLQVRDFASARRHLKIAMELSPKSAGVHDALALTFHASGELELAEKHYKKAIAYGNGASQFRINYANFLFKQQQFKLAASELEIIAEDSLYEKRETGLILLGLTQQQLLEPAAAKRSFERALVLNPRHSRVLRELAIMNYEAADYAKSWQYFMQYRQVVGQLNAEMLLLGIHLTDELNNSDAKVSFVLALKNLYPDSSEYQSYLRDSEQRVRLPSNSKNM